MVASPPPPPAPSPEPAEAANTEVPELSEEELEAATAPEAAEEESLEDELGSEDEVSGVMEGLSQGTTPSEPQAPQNIRGKKRNRR